MYDLLAVMLSTQNLVYLGRAFNVPDINIHASYWLNIPSKFCVVPWYTTATSVVGPYH
jgi:hypothetical protein